jgi:Ca-activated chloride channel homolog
LFTLTQEGLRPRDSPSRKRFNNYYFLTPTRVVFSRRKFAGNSMKQVLRHVHPLRRVLVTLAFLLAASCILPRLGFALHHISHFTSGVAAAQSHVPIIRVEVDLQPIEVQVKDVSGNDVTGLSAKDFTIFENGQRQKISFFDAGSGPVSITILVDSSNTIASDDRVGSAQEVAAQFMRTARAGDDVWAMDFTDQMGLFRHLSSEQLLNPSAVTVAPAPSHGSAIYDAIATALCHLRTQKNLRQAVIVITDGVDQHSRISLDQLTGLVRSSRAQLFMIGLHSRPEFGFQRTKEPRIRLITGHYIDNPTTVFASLAKESGAESFAAKSESSLSEGLKAVSDMLQSEYTLAYYPQKNADKLRKIKVKVDRRDLSVLARHFVDSQQDASQFVHFGDATCIVSPKFHPYPYEADVTNGPSGMTYRENFSNPRSGWPIHEDSHYVSGGYELSSSDAPLSRFFEAVQTSGSDVVGLSAATRSATMGPSGIRQNVIAAYGPWWVDLRASVNVRITPAAGPGVARPQFAYASPPSAGLLFRMNPKGYYALLLKGIVEKKKLSVALVRRDFLSESDEGYSETLLVPWTIVENASTPTADLSVEVLKDQISILVNGTEVKSVSDRTYDQGLVGLVMSGPGVATFANLIVQQK